MAYFDDIHFVNGAISPRCTAEMDCCFDGTYSFEFMRTGRLYFGVDGGEQVVLEAPVAFWHHPDHSYQYGALEDEGWYHHWVLMQGPRARRLVEEGFAPLSPSGYVPVRSPRLMAELFQVLIEQIRPGRADRRGEAVVVLERMLVLLLAEARSNGTRSAHGAEIEAVARALEAEPLRVYDFRAEARGLGLSYSHFRRVFRQQVGAAPHDYLLTCRMQHAAALLRDTTASVAEVAAACGCWDAARFSRLFRQRIGLSPRQYRLSLVR